MGLGPLPSGADASDGGLDSASAPSSVRSKPDRQLGVAGFPADLNAELG